MADNKIKLTKTFVNNITPTEKRAFYYDSEEKGLYLQVTPTGAKSYYLYKKVNGIPERIKLGNVDEFKAPDGARNEAGKIKRMIRDGKNPTQEKKKLKKETTLNEMYNVFMNDKRKHLKEKTYKEYERIWNVELKHLGNKSISIIKGEDLKRLHNKLSDRGIYIANRCIVLIRTMYNHFINDGTYDGDNPATKVKLNKEEPRVRYLEHKELESFFEELNKDCNCISRYAILMLIYTGARKNNVLTMKWEDIDLDAKIWKIPETKTAKNTTLALVEPAMALLNDLKVNATSKYVFPSSSSKTGHIVDIKKVWETILKRCNIKNLRIHDLRHTLATYLIANGADAFMVKRALSHKSLQSTEVYVNLGIEHLRDKLNDTVDKMINIGK